MGMPDIDLTKEDALKKFLLDIDCLNELQPWTGHFNLFDVLKISRTEIRHSNMLGWLLNPNENHGMGDAFLKAIIQELVVNDIDGRYDIFRTLLLDFYSFVVYREWKNIDILLISEEEQFLIAIENKITSREHNNQLYRYRRILESDYPNYSKMFIFLTPDGDDPSDLANWAILSYEAIAYILTKQKNELELQPDVDLMIKNYLEVIRRDIVKDRELIEICNKIYMKHKKALDLIFEYRTDGRSQFLEQIRYTMSEIAEEGSIEYSVDNSSGTYFIFHTETMNRYLPALQNRISSWGNEFVYQYWVHFRDNRLCGVCELGGWNVPEDSMVTMQKMINLLKPDDKRKESFKSKRLFRTKWYEIDESSQIEDEISCCVRKIVKDLLQQENRLLRDIDQIDERK